MSQSKQHVIVYHPDNQQVATQIREDLVKQGYHVEAQGLDSSTLEPLGQAVTAPGGAILLLVTDNFLKSENCMNGAMQALKNWADNGQLVPVVADGRQPTADGAGWEAVPTVFERVSNIIQYMNFWQDRYLVLRKEKRTHEDDEFLDKKIEITKTVSGEVGEFLRYLRNLHWYTLEDFKSKSYAAFRQFTDDTAEIETEAEYPAANEPETVPADTTPPPPRPKTLAEIIQDSGEELIAENTDLGLKKNKGAVEQPPVDLDEIPGLDLLKKELGSLVSKSFENLPTLEGEEDDDDEEAEEGEELTAILSEVFGEKDDEVEPLKFVGEDPEKPEDFDLESLFDEDDVAEPEAGGDDEVSLELVSDDDEGLVLRADGGGRSTPEEVLEHAVLLFDDDKKTDGLDFLKKTVQLNAGDNTMRYYYAYALARYGQDFPNAKTQLEIILAKDKEHTDALFLLGELSENQGDFAEAKHNFETVAALQPDFPEVYYRLGLLTLQHFEGQEKLAFEFFKKSVEYNPRNPDAQYILATLYNEQAGDAKNALEHFKKALKYDPQHAFANYDLALLYFRQGERELASRHYEQATQLNPDLKSAENDAIFQLHEVDILLETHATEAVETHQPEEVLEEPVAVPVETTHSEAIGNETVEEITEVAPDEIKLEESLGEAALEEVAEAVTEPILEAKTVAEPIEDFTPTPEDILENEDEEKAEELAAAKPAETESPVEKTVLISGATSGIGRATAEIFARNGYRVIATGRRADRLEALQQDFKEKYNADLLTLPFDVRNLEAVKSAIESLPEAWQEVDILINNAGLSRGLAPIHEGDIEHWETMIDTNVKGLLYLTRAIAPQMVKRRSGHIVNVASSAAKEVYPGGNVYCASKFAVDALTKAMRLDLYTHNVRVSQVAPGHVEETEFAKVRFDGDEERAAKVYDSFQPLKPGDVAEVIYFVATRPAHVNVQDVLLFATQQAGSNFIDRSGRGEE
ncbi:MAG: SDR family NAD(P)-dependent oxidoreductase [Bacteroidetes bacterium]|nr:SDR family NAD(P)-dependent oxidoreductase [Bacteroidota bacterium]